MADYFFAADTELASQSTLSTTYTAALSSYLQVSAADYIGFLAYTVNGATLEEALAIVDSVEAGQFTLADLFAAAQTKTLTGDVDTYEAGITDASPTLTVNGVTIDLTAILSDPDVAYWLTTTKKEGNIYHLREFYTAADEPEGYDAGWSVVDVNVAPEAVTFEETATEWNIKADAPTDGAEWVSIDLLQGTASDADGDAISVVADSVSVNGTLLADATDLYVVDGNTLKINTNSEYFKLLFAGQTTDLAVSYEITDGIEGHEVASSGTITVTGTADQFTMQGTASATVNTFPSDFDGSFNVVILTSQLVAGATTSTDLSISGTATVTAVGDLGGTTETIKFAVEGVVGTFTLGDTAPGNNTFGSKEPGDNSYEDGTSTGSSGFSSGDVNVTVAYDSNTSDAQLLRDGVDGLTSVTAVLSDVTYWA